MSNKTWDLISYQQAEAASWKEKVKRMDICDDALDLADEVRATYMRLNCSGYGKRCRVDCDVWTCPYSTSDAYDE